MQSLPIFRYEGGKGRKGKGRGSDGERKKKGKTEGSALEKDRGSEEVPRLYWALFCILTSSEVAEMDGGGDGI